MPFGARQEDGKWRLCWRKGRTIVHVRKESFPGVEIVFRSQAKAKACADALNSTYWPAYEKTEKGRAELDWATYAGMLETIAEHGGLTPMDMKKLTET